MNEKRKRKKSILLRLTEEEFQKLNSKVELTNLNREEFIRTIIFEKQVYKKEFINNLNSLIWEVRRIGQNLNQVLLLYRVEGIDSERIFQVEQIINSINQILVNINSNF